MNSQKILAVVLIAAGVLGLVYGTFSYTEETHGINLGSLEMTVQERKSVNIPAWAGVGAIGLGAFLVLFAKRNP